MSAQQLYRFTAEFTVAIPGNIDPLVAGSIILDAILETVPLVLTAQGISEPVVLGLEESLRLLEEVMPGTTDETTDSGISETGYPVPSGWSSV